MLVEIANVTQLSGEPPRRWFRSDHWDLIVWCDGAGEPMGFQLCYPVADAPFALTWLPSRGYSHCSIDEGDRVGANYKAVPILLRTSEVFPARAVLDAFLEVSAGIPPGISAFVSGKLRGHPDFPRDR